MNRRLLGRQKEVRAFQVERHGMYRSREICILESMYNPVILQ